MLEHFNLSQAILTITCFLRLCSRSELAKGSLSKVAKCFRQFSKLPYNSKTVDILVYICRSKCDFLDKIHLSALCFLESDEDLRVPRVTDLNPNPNPKYTKIPVAL